MRTEDDFLACKQGIVSWQWLPQGSKPSNRRIMPEEAGQKQAGGERCRLIKRAASSRGLIMSHREEGSRTMLQAENERRGTTAGSEKAAHHVTGRTTNPNGSLGTGIFHPVACASAVITTLPLLCSINPLPPGVKAQSPAVIQLRQPTLSARPGTAIFEYRSAETGIVSAHSNLSFQGCKCVESTNFSVTPCPLSVLSYGVYVGIGAEDLRRRGAPKTRRVAPAASHARAC